VLDSAQPARIQFDGFYYSDFDIAAISVQYGPVLNPLQYRCTVLPPPLTTPNTVTCRSALYSQGINMRFTVSVEGQLAPDVGLIITFPVIPTISRVSGCTDVGNTTVLCPTEGNVTITVFGTNFVQSQLAVTVAGAECTNPVVRSLFELTCTLPIGSGGEPRGVVVQRATQASATVPFLTYSPPTITNITGCQVPVPYVPLYTDECDTCTLPLLRLFVCVFCVEQSLTFTLFSAHCSRWYHHHSVRSRLRSERRSDSDR
jgi:hypothetical protein